MTLNGGFGDVTAIKNVVIRTNVAEELAAVKHCNGVDVWVVCHDATNSNYYAFLVTATGVNPVPVISAAGLPCSGNVTGFLKISPNGKKIAYSEVAATFQFHVADFNRSTGAVSSAISLTSTTGMQESYGIEFSPNSQLLYNGSLNLTTGYYQFRQWNLCGNPASILASATIVDSSDTFHNQMQLGIDGKIYIAMVAGNLLSVINNPNTLGAGCNYTFGSITLNPPALSSTGLPNFISSYFAPPIPPIVSTVSCLSASFTPPSITSNTACASSSNSITAYQWNFGDPASASNNTSTAVNPTHVYTSSGTYTVNLILTVSCGTTALTHTLSVTSCSPPVSPTVTVNSANLCSGNCVALTATVSGGAAPLSYTWTPNIGTGPGPHTVCPSTTSTYTIAVTDALNITSINVATVQVIPSPTFNASSSTNFILGCAPVNVTTLCINNASSIGGVQFAFLPPTSTLSVPIPTVLFSTGTQCTATAVPGTWTLVVGDGVNKNCQTALPVVILTNTVAPDVSAGILTQTLTCVNPTVLAVGTSSTPNTDLGWLIPSAPFSLPTPTITLGPVTAGATNTNLPNFYGTYTAVATNTINQCKSTQTYSIYQNFYAPSNIGIGVSTPSNITCHDPCVSLSFTGATLSYAGGVSIPTNTWTGPPPTSNTSTLSTTSACVAGDYTLTVTDGKSGCAASKVYKVIEQLNTPVLANLPSYTLDCSATSSVSAALIQISLTSTLSNWSIFVSSFPANAAFSNINLTTPPNGLTVTPTGATTGSFTVDKTGSYSFTAKNLITGCTEDGVFQVVAGGLNADFSPSTLTGFAPLGVTFSNLSSSSSAATGTSSITTVWNFGNGTAQTTTATSISTNATYNNPGTYTVTIVSTKGSCIDSAYKVIRVDIPSKLEIPNVFTPNGDGSNDVFFLKTSNLTEITALIFDRWGNKVYDLTSSTGNIAWDGKNLEGKECVAGIYFYIIKAKGKDEQSYERKGNVSLFR
jgi:gliding motility-associated-like protein